MIGLAKCAVRALRVVLARSIVGMRVRASSSARRIYHARRIFAAGVVAAMYCVRALAVARGKSTVIAPVHVSLSVAVSARAPVAWIARGFFAKLTPCARTPHPGAMNVREQYRDR